MSEFYVAEMPSNIALIKYMGKVPGANKNKPTNASLSFTLSSLLSRVEIFSLDEDGDAKGDEWVPLRFDNWISPDLSEKGKTRFLAHFAFLKEHFGIQGRFQVRSANNFPSDCGIASSASSFAAMTMAAYRLALAQNPRSDRSVEQLAELSRAGSGSSIRSFMGPFVLWNESGVSAVELPYEDLIHKTVIVDAGKKAVSSSDAHERVRTSPSFDGRVGRAEQRLSDLLAAFRARDWGKAFDITWAEFFDMHNLFQTSVPSFQYMTTQSLDVLNVVREYWTNEKDGPLVTMDAGANVHLLYRGDQKKAACNIQTVIEDRLCGVQEQGAPL